jgi:hypothetical protein
MRGRGIKEGEREHRIEREKWNKEKGRQTEEQRRR